MVWTSATYRDTTPRSGVRGRGSWSTGLDSRWRSSWCSWGCRSHTCRRRRCSRRSAALPIADCPAGRGSRRSRPESCHSSRSWTSRSPRPRPAEEQQEEEGVEMVVVEDEEEKHMRRRASASCSVATPTSSSCSTWPDLQVEAGVLHDSLGQRGDVDPAVTLPRQEELLPSVFWEQPQELLQGQVVVQRHLSGEGPVSQTRPPPTSQSVRSSAHNLTSVSLVT